MDTKKYALISGIVFLIIAILHGARVLWQWSATIGTWAVPLWLSIIVVIAAGYMASQGFKHGKL